MLAISNFLCIASSCGLVISSSLVEHLQARNSCISRYVHFTSFCYLSSLITRFAWFAEIISLWRFVMGGRIIFHRDLSFLSFLLG